MSSSITMTGVTGDPTLARLILDSATTHSRLDRLTNQASTGLIADNYAGLGTGASVSLDLRPQVANLQTWQNNVDAATGRMSVAQSALTQLQSVAANFYAQLNNVQSVNASEVDTIAASARDALRQVAGLLDTQDGSVYVFAGQDTGNPPVPAPDSILTSGFYTQINAAVGNLAINGAAATATATYNVATSNAAGTSPFSAWLSQPSATLRANPPVVQVGQNQTEPVGIPASANGLIPDSVSTGNTIVGGPPSTTGSYMRDVLRALATIGSLSSAQANAPGFDNLLQDTHKSVARSERHGAGRRRVGQRAVVAHRHADQARGHPDCIDRTGLVGRRRRHGRDAVEAVAGADADAGLLPAHRHTRRYVAGEVPAGRSMKMSRASLGVNSAPSVWPQARKKAGACVTLWTEG
jgi:flagellar hook-associated protein 3 FlgL